MGVRREAEMKMRYDIWNTLSAGLCTLARAQSVYEDDLISGIGVIHAVIGIDIKSARPRKTRALGFHTKEQS